MWRGRIYAYVNMKRMCSILVRCGCSQKMYTSSQRKLQLQCKNVPAFIHSFTELHQHSILNEGMKSPYSTSFFSAIYSKAFKRSNQKLWTSSRETGPKHPEEPFCLTFIHSCSFSRVPPESIWQTLVKKKDFEGRKTTSRSCATHTPSAVVLSSFIIYRLCALIWFLQFGLVVIVVVLVVLFFVCLSSSAIWDSEGGGKKSSPMCI